MKKIIIPIFLAMILGCAHMAAERELNRIANRTPKMTLEELQTVQTECLIRGYWVCLWDWHPQDNTNIKAELSRRGLVDYAWWTAIENKKILMGMTKEAIRLSWGKPRRINRTVGSWGIHEQWIYGKFPNAPYLYLENGLVTGWQD